jgi:hypothetical protein
VSRHPPSKSPAVKLKNRSKFELTASDFDGEWFY